MVIYPITYMVSYISGGAGFLPSRVGMENGPGLKMYFLLNMGVFHCYVSLLEGTLPTKKTNLAPPRRVF